MASIRERTSEQGETTWAVLFRVGKTQRSQTFRTEKLAEDFRSLVEILGPAKALATLAAKSNDQGLTVDELAERFFAWKARDVQPRTIADYHRDYANWIKAPLGSRVADTVDELDVQNWVDSMRDRLEPKSIADRHMLLHSMFKFGVARTRRLVEHNPCTETQLPRRVKKPAKGFTLSEYAALRDTARRLHPDAADLLEFIAATGWRWSEASALKVRAIEEYADENGVWHMYATMQSVTRGGRAVEGAKSDAGFRRVKIPKSAAAVIRSRIIGKGSEDLVFTNSAGRKWYQQNFLNRTWTTILAEAKVEPYADGKRKTPHALRHTHVAILDRAGASTAEMQRRLGHEDIQTTINVYGGMIDDIDDDVLERVDEMLNRPEQIIGEVVSGTVVAELA